MHKHIASANGLHASNSYGAAVAEAEMIFSEIQNGKPMTQVLSVHLCASRRFVFLFDTPKKEAKKEAFEAFFFASCSTPHRLLLTQYRLLLTHYRR